MGQDSKIEWTHHTFNPWWGCIRVSPGCEHCYAETFAKRLGMDIWGPAKTTERRLFGDKHWSEPVKWNKAAEKTGERKRVFCASMADVFEDHPQLVETRARLFDLIEQTPALDWLLLTKRPENMYPMLPPAWRANPRPNVWLGTTAEDQQRFDERIDKLMGTPAAVHFLSCEPLLGPIDTRGYRPAWIICGGESGHGARAMHPKWARSLRDQCEAKGIAYHFKQWGEWLPFERVGVEGEGAYAAADGRLVTVDELMRHPHEIRDNLGIVKLGKHSAGRLLDGRTWDEFPR